MALLCYGAEDIIVVTNISARRSEGVLYMRQTYSIFIHNNRTDRHMGMIYRHDQNAAYSNRSKVVLTHVIR